MEAKEVHFSSTTNWMDTDNPHRQSYWAFCVRKPNENYYQQITNLTTCRETLAVHLKDELERPVYIKHTVNKEKTILMCLLMPGPKMFRQVEKRVKGYFRASLNLVNFFERRAKLGLTKMYNVKLVGGPDKLKSYARLFIGPKVWMYSPHLLSTYVMLIRIGKFRQFKTIKSYKQFCEKTNELVEMLNDFVLEGKQKHIKNLFFWPRGASHDAFHLYLAADKIMPILKNIDVLFGKRKRETIFRKAEIYVDGITNLCLAKTKDTALNEAFRKLCDSKKLTFRDTTLNSKLYVECKNDKAHSRRACAYDDCVGKDMQLG